MAHLMCVNMESQHDVLFVPFDSQKGIVHCNLNRPYRLQYALGASVSRQLSPSTPPFLLVIS